MLHCMRARKTISMILYNDVTLKLENIIHDLCSPEQRDLWKALFGVHRFGFNHQRESI